jgi:hypothetical protein
VTSDETKFFVLVDDFVQRNHQCKLTEFFLSPGGDEYILCFRPLEGEATAHRYINLPTSQVDIVSSLKVLPGPLAECLDYELRNLGGNP